MQLTDDIRYRALLARDPRFDGMFFVGVSTTGIYCRSVCPARKPAQRNCSFYPSAAAAEREGFRPCLRCRPEFAPREAPGANDNVAPAIIARIQAGALNNGGGGGSGGSAGVTALARQFDLSPRQVQRIVREHAGVSPIELAQTARLLLAKQLLTETTLPITRIAFASGFASVRRFNDCFREHYHLQPRELRAESANRPARAGATMRLRLSYRPPFDFSALLAFLAPRAIPAVEHVTANSYARTVALNDLTGWLRVEHHRTRPMLEAELSAELAPAVQPILARLRNLFDLDARPDIIDDHLAQSERLAPLVRARPGTRVPGAFDTFELAWRAILGQQVSVRGATTLSGRLAHRLGEPIETPITELTRLSPTNARVASATPSRLASIGLPIARAKTLREIARLHAADSAQFEPGAPIEPITERLLAIRGVGPWTTSYIAMRALRWPDAFPESDLGLKHALGERSPARIRAIAEPWRPWRAYAARHLWQSLDTSPTP